MQSSSGRISLLIRVSLSQHLSETRRLHFPAESYTRLFESPLFTNGSQSAFSIQLFLETTQSAFNRLTFSNSNFRQVRFPFLRNLPSSLSSAATATTAAVTASAATSAAATATTASAAVPATSTTTSAAATATATTASWARFTGT